MNYTKQNWIDCGHGRFGIDPAKVEQDLGKKMRFGKTYSFEWMCHKVLLRLTKQAPHCPLHGRGFRSQWYGEEVAKVWPEPTVSPIPTHNGVT